MEEYLIDFFGNNINNLMETDVSCFYHVTEAGMDETVFEEGLQMVAKELYTTMIPIDDEILADPIAFVDGEKNRGINRSKGSIVLIGIQQEDLSYAVRKNVETSNNWTADDPAEHVLDSRYIIGSIDIDSYELSLNDNFYLSSEMDYTNDKGKGY